MQPPSERPDKDAENGEPVERTDASISRFSALAQRLFAVDPRGVRDARREMLTKRPGKTDT